MEPDKDDKKKFNYCKINNPEEKYCHNKKKAEKEYAKNITEDEVYNKLFISKTSNQDNDRKIFIAGSGATSHMVNSEDNMTNLKDTEKNSP